MYKLLLAITMIFVLSGCSKDPMPSPNMAAIIASTPAVKTYNFEVMLEFESSVGANDEAAARKEVGKIFKDTFGWKPVDELIILKSVIE